MEPRISPAHPAAWRRVRALSYLFIGGAVLGFVALDFFPLPAGTDLAGTRFTAALSLVARRGAVRRRPPGARVGDPGRAGGGVGGREPRHLLRGRDPHRRRDVLPVGGGLRLLLPAAPVGGAGARVGGVAYAVVLSQRGRAGRLDALADHDRVADDGRAC